MANNLYTSFKRLKGFPLDADSVFNTFAEAEAYTHGKTSYPGQIISVINDINSEKNAVYMIGRDETHASGKSITAVSGDAEAISELNARIDAANLKINKVESSVKETDSKITALENKLVEDIDTKLENFATKDSVKKISDKLASHVEEFNGHVNAYNEKVLELSNEIKKIKENFKTADIDSLAEIAKWFKDNADIVDTVKSVTTAVSTLQDSVASITDRLNTVDSRLNHIDTSINIINSNANDLSKRVTAAEHSLSHIKLNYATKEDIKDIVENSGNCGVIKVVFGNTASFQEVTNILKPGCVIENISVDIENNISTEFYLKISLVNQDGISDSLVLIESDENTAASYINTAESGKFNYLLDQEINNNSRVDINFGGTSGQSGLIKIFYKTLVK